jgi:hypothetical protein
VFEVVEQEQQLVRLDVGGQRLLDRLARLFADAKRLRDRGDDELGVCQRRERDEVDAAGERLDELRRELQRESRFARAARPRQREQPNVGLAEEAQHLGELALSADERSRLHGQVGGAVLERLQRRKLVRQPFDPELVEPLWLGEILQPVLTKVT